MRAMRTLYRAGAGWNAWPGNPRRWKAWIEIKSAGSASAQSAGSSILIVTSVQTGAHAQDAAVPAPAVSLVPVATGLVHPWAVAFCPAGSFGD